MPVHFPSGRQEGRSRAIGCAVKLDLGAFETLGRVHTDTSVPLDRARCCSLRGQQWVRSRPLSWAEPDAQQLADAGWLELRTVDATGDTCWFWTQQAETALDMNELRRTDPADLN
jgi:hypothetical protein